MILINSNLITIADRPIEMIYEKKNIYIYIYIYRYISRFF